MTPVEERKSLIDAVEKALVPVEKGVDAASPAADQNRSQQDEVKTQAEKPADGNGEPPELSDEELGRLSKKTQDRMRFLAEQKSTLSGELEQIRPAAERAAQLDGYLQQNGISGDELNNTLQLTSLIKAGKYAEAYSAMEPIFSELSKRAGKVLDPDLQEAVRLGNTPIEHAKELQALRAGQVAQKTVEQTNAERQQVAQWNNHVDSVAKAADDWAKTKAQSDPDWTQKQDLLSDQVKLDIRENGFPRSAKEAIERSEKSLKLVEDRLKRFRPTPQSITPNTGGGRASTPKPTAPKDARQAVFMALDGDYGG